MDFQLNPAKIAAAQNSHTAIMALFGHGENKVLIDGYAHQSARAYLCRINLCDNPDFRVWRYRGYRMFGYSAERAAELALS